MEKSIEQEILERIVRIETKIDGYNNLKEKLDETYMISKSNEKDITEIKSNNKWLWRTIVGTFIALIISFIWNWRG